MTAGSSRRTETVDGAAHTYDYRYDADGQLPRSSATPARQVVGDRAYTYDDNGNRDAELDAGPVETATFDDDDRMTARGRPPTRTTSGAS